ncbi:hypothetical protein FRB93_000519 [Tulasnella sp. JGI-2019a]|nr:hypothetical protein FRB93_000519 [Tulasnella sp. JGI-2019a]
MNVNPQKQKRLIEHACGILEALENGLKNVKSQRILASGKVGGSYSVATVSLLRRLIHESGAEGFRGVLVEQFWSLVAEVEPLLTNNIQLLGTKDYINFTKSLEELGNGLPGLNVESTFKLLFKKPKGRGANEANSLPLILGMAAELFTHLGVAIINPGGPGSGEGLLFAVDETLYEETEKILQGAGGDFGERAQSVLKEACLLRDGKKCPITDKSFEDNTGYKPILAHVIPNAIYSKTDTMACINSLAGPDVVQEIVQYLNSPRNAINMEANAHTSYDDMHWAIEAVLQGGQYKYFYRKLTPELKCIEPRQPDTEIHFGTNSPPLPRLCNLKYRVNLCLKLSGAADVIEGWMKKKDEEGDPKAQPTPAAFSKFITGQLASEFATSTIAAKA